MLTINLIGTLVPMHRLRNLTAVSSYRSTLRTPKNSHRTAKLLTALSG